VKLRYRLLIAAVLLALAFVVDRVAFGVLRALTLYQIWGEWGEMREGLLAAKFLGSGLGTVVIALVVGVLDRRRWRRAGVLVLVVAAAGLTTTVLKGVAGRERPSHRDQVVGQERIEFHGPGRGLREAPFQSFPSGHTTGVFASATCLAAFYPPAGAVFYAIAGAAAVQRVVDHEHFLSDVVAGAMVGHLLAMALLAWPRLRRVWEPELVDTVDTVDSAKPSP
jgi:membrane-associated phospholipid phosphatase